MTVRRVLLISVLLNLVLIGWALGSLGFSRGDGDSTAPDRGWAESRLPSARSPSSTTTDGPNRATPVSQRFRWSRIETNDLVQLALNLRGVGCPEKTVREVVSARAIRALLRSTQAAAPRQPFWTVGGPRERALRESEIQAAAARDKIRATLEQALGPGNFLENPKGMRDIGEQAIMRIFTGPMSEESFAQLQIAFTGQEARREEIRSRAQGVLLAEDEAAMDRSSQRLHEQIAAVLTPAELEEFLARAGVAKMAGGELHFDAMGISAAEARQIGLVRGRLGFETLSTWWEGFVLSEDQESQVATDLRERFGPKRYAEIERAANTNVIQPGGSRITNVNGL